MQIRVMRDISNVQTNRLFRVIHFPFTRSKRKRFHVWLWIAKYCNPLNGLWKSSKRRAQKGFGWYMEIEFISIHTWTWKFFLLYSGVEWNIMSVERNHEIWFESIDGIFFSCQSYRIFPPRGWNKNKISACAWNFWKENSCTHLKCYQLSVCYSWILPGFCRWAWILLHYCPH